ncbi:hypothetical protein BHE90_015702 [Fusarium euwallaceae]|uniref:Unsaturated rhamnogalacturonyl hydrolase YesR n=3 Tax=Fusarium solani species complex TaxID=232080 RepID=A0A430L2I3_9HYPO|nr:hypothetical protein CEP51_013754 [Fusarium floridanum]RTE69918.1 hypothetical protein BHE90_015702 [Fusarium euwallaceae]
MPTQFHGINSVEVHAKIQLLIDALVNSKDESGKYTVTSLDGRVIDTKGWTGWEWTQGIGLNGIWAYYSLTGEERYLKIIEDWFAHQIAAGSVPKNVNTMAPFLSLAYLYEKTGNQTYLPWLDAWGEWAYHDLARTKYGGFQHTTYVGINEQQLWDDTLMMAVLPLAKIGILLQRPHYVEEAKKQFLIHIKYLFDTKTGLFYHGWTFEGGHNFASAFWARGNSWLTMAIPEFLDLISLPANDPVQTHLIDTLEAQVEALRARQLESGLWPTLVDHKVEDGSYPEASATAGFAFGILKAQRKRFLGPQYTDTAIRAIKGVLANIDSDGELLNTSYGTPMGHTLQFYKDIPLTLMPYGQAMAIQALVEFLFRFI